MNREIRKLAWFVWRHFPRYKEWGRVQLRKWITFHYTRAFLASVKDRNERVVALGIARPIMTVEDSRDWCAFDNEGRIILVELAIAPSSKIRRALATLMLRRFGQRESIAFQRRFEERVRVYPFTKIMHRITKREESYV